MLLIFLFCHESAVFEAKWDKTAGSRTVETRWSLRPFSAQTNLWCCDSVKMFAKATGSFLRSILLLLLLLLGLYYSLSILPDYSHKYLYVGRNSSFATLMYKLMLRYIACISDLLIVSIILFFIALKACSLTHSHENALLKKKKKRIKMRESS